jgi:hypothetical protein
MLCLSLTLHGFLIDLWVIDFVADFFRIGVCLILVFLTIARSVGDSTYASGFFSLFLYPFTGSI